MGQNKWIAEMGSFGTRKFHQARFLLVVGRLGLGKMEKLVGSHPFDRGLLV